MWSASTDDHRPGRPIRRVTVVLAVAMGAAAGTAQALPPAGVVAGLPRAEATADLHRVAVFGKDDRIKLPRHLEGLRASIGLIYNERTRTVCTAFCVGDDVLATASHCVFRTKGENPPPPEQFFFARPGTKIPSVRFAGHLTRSSAQQIVAGTVGISTKPPIDAARDWALIRLQSPACRGRSLAVEPLTPDDIEREAQAGKLFQVAFHRDFGRWTMAYAAPCEAGRNAGAEKAQANITERDFSDPLNLVLHTCDTGGASSGSPLLIERPGGPHVAAINVGTFVQARVLIEEGVVVKRTPASPVANTAVASIAFASKVEPLRSASILSAPADLKALQRELHALHLLDGEPDGKYDRRTRMAIELYEAGAGLPILGVPTRALLETFQATSRPTAGARGR